MNVMCYLFIALVDSSSVFRFLGFSVSWFLTMAALLYLLRVAIGPYAQIIKIAIGIRAFLHIVLYIDRLVVY
jgi:hypothetical protein